MNIKVDKQYKSINPFEIEDLPDFVVITGENGSGKTQLLEYLCASSYFDDQGIFIAPDEEITNVDLFDNELVDRYTDVDSGTEKFSFHAVLSINGSRLKNIVYRPVVTPSISVGESFNIDSVLRDADDFAIKHLFVHNYREDGGDMANVTREYNRTLKIQKPTGFQSRDFKAPEITNREIAIIEQIEEKYGLDFEKDRYYYISSLNPPHSQLFSANLRYLFFQYWAREKAGLTPTIKPWAEFNEIGRSLGFRFEIDEPNLNERRFDVRLRDAKKGLFISPDSLSSGEKVVFSLFVALYSARTMSSKPDAIFFDEPDAYLHPSLTDTMLSVINNIFVKRYGIKVIITTHSPSTIALSPEPSVYSMGNGVMTKVSKKEAILSLTKGLNTLSVYYENNKQVFVEAKNDAMVLKSIFHFAKQENWLKTNDIQLHFINVGEDSTDGGCSKVKDIVERLKDTGNQTVYGLIDYDNKNSPKGRIIILGNGSRYAIDNYVMDPISVSLLFLRDRGEKEKIGFLIDDSIVSFASKTNDDIQSIISTIILCLEKNLPTNNDYDRSEIKYSLADGKEFMLPGWFVKMKGHDLVELYKKTFPYLNQYKSEYLLYKEIINVSYSNYPWIIPGDIIDSLIDLQSAN